KRCVVGSADGAAGAAAGLPARAGAPQLVLWPRRRLLERVLLRFGRRAVLSQALAAALLHRLVRVVGGRFVEPLGRLQTILLRGARPGAGAARDVGGVGLAPEQLRFVGTRARDLARRLPVELALRDRQERGERRGEVVREREVEHLVLQLGARAAELDLVE